MKEIRKILSFMLVATLILSCFSTGVLASGTSLANTETSKYLVNEDYNDGSTGSWKVINLGRGTVSNNNGAIAHTPTGGGSGIATGCVATRPLNGGAGYAFETGKPIYIETRLKQTDHTKGLDFKINTKANSSTQIWSASYCLFEIANGKITAGESVTSGWGTLSSVNKITTLDTTDWIDVKIELYGDPTGATQAYGTATFTDKNGATASMPFKHAFLPGISALKSIDLHTAIYDSSNTVMMDYLRIYEMREISATISSSVDVKGNVEITIDSGSAVLTDISAYFDIYKSGVLVPSTKVFDAANKKIIIDPDNDLDASAVGAYTVNVDKARLRSEAFYDYSSDVVSTTLSIIPCSVSEVEVLGFIAENNTLSAGYTFSSPFNEITHIYKWFWRTSDTDGWTEISGVNTKDITIADSLAFLKDKQVRCSVTPYCDSPVNGGAGVEVFSQNIKKPEKKPVASNLKLEKARVYLNETITALYDYYDENGDEQVNSEIIWYQSSSPAFSNPVEIVRSLDLNVNSDLLGKYIRFSVTPKNNGNANKVGDIVYSPIYGPVTEKSFSSTGYLVNEDYNDGTIGAWTVLNSGKGIIESISQGGGNYAIAHTPTGGGSGLETGCVATRPLNNGSGYAFDNGKTFVIETRLKQTDHSKGLYFKLNTKRGSGTQIWSAAYALFEIKTGMITAGESVTSGWGTLSSVNKITTLDTTDWLDVVIELKGDPTGATQANGTVTFTDKHGATASMPFKHAYLPGISVLESIDLHTAIYDESNTVMMDYLKISEVVSLTASVNPDVTTSENVEIAINTLASSLDDISGFFELYKDGVRVPAIKTFDSVSKKVTIDPLEPLDANSNGYVVKVDKDGLRDDAHYAYNSDTVTFALNILPCKAYDVSISGKLVEGNIIESFYEYDSDYDEVGSVYKWYRASSPNGPWTVIPGLDTRNITVTSDILGSYIKFSVEPHCNFDGNDGVGLIQYSSNILIPERKPVVSNLRLNKSALYLNETFGALYDYYDENGDEETDTEILWFEASSSDFSDAAEFARGKNITITDANLGKYIKYRVTPVNNGVINSVGEDVYSPVYGPVADILEVTNLLNNSGFETGDLTGWNSNYTTADGQSGIEICSTDTYAGNYSLLVRGKPTLESKWYQSVGIIPGKEYIISGWAKAVSAMAIPEYEGFVDINALITEYRPYRDNEYTTIYNSSWTKISSVFVNTTDFTSAGIGLFTLENDGIDDILVDDMYFGELAVSDIQTYEVEPITIPERGTTKVAIASGVLYNQLGTTQGLENKSVIVTAESRRGISIKDNMLVVSSEAYAGDVVLTVSCAQPAYSKEVVVKLLPNGNVTPVASNVTVSGEANAGATLTLSYDFYQVENKADVSTYRWFYKESPTGVKNYIEGATSRTYVLDAAYENKLIGCEVIPAVAGKVGTAVESNLLSKSVAPYAYALDYAGKMSVGETITGTYTYADVNNDAEGDSVYAWYLQNSDGSYSVVSSSKELTLTENMIGKYLKFAVTPKSNVAPTTGAVVMSEPVLGPAYPVASNVSITRSGSRYVGDYDFYHPHGFADYGTKYEWVVDGAVVSTAIDYIPTFSGTKAVRFNVIPGCNANPAFGEKVTTAMYITGTGTSGGSGGAGGGFGGGDGTTVVPPIDDLEKPEVETPYVALLIEAGGGEAEELKAGKEYVPTISISTNASIDKLTLIGVLYKNDIADKVVIRELDVASGVYTTDENIFIPNDNNVYKVKLFVWDSESGMKPLCKAKEIFKVED